MKKYTTIILLCLSMVSVFVISLSITFPGRSVADYIEFMAGQQSSIKLKLSPVLIRPTAVVVKQVVATLPDGKQLELKDTAISIGQLWQGLTVSTALGDSSPVSLSAPWGAGNVLIEADDFELADLPAQLWPEATTVSGRLDFSAEMQTDGLQQLMQLQRANPFTAQGSIDQFSIDNGQVMGISLPQMDFPLIEFDISGDENAINLNTVRLNGTLAGQANGTLNPDWRNILLSQIRLDIRANIEQQWISNLGNLAVIVNGFARDGRLSGVLEGNLIQPQWTNL